MYLHNSGEDTDNAHYSGSTKRRLKCGLTVPKVICKQANGGEKKTSSQHQVWSGPIIKKTRRARVRGPAMTLRRVSCTRDDNTAITYLQTRVYIFLFRGKTSFSKVHKMQQSYRVMHTVVDYNVCFHLQH